MLLASLAATVVLVAAGVIASALLSGGSAPTVAAGPLTGTYRADFGPTIGVDDVPDVAAPPALTSAYGLRSVCRSSGCVATAARLGGESVAPPAMVFDQVGAAWIAVTVVPDRCRETDAEFWQVFRLQPRPDGTLAGEYTEASGNVCADKRFVTFTRTGDVDSARLADPASQAPRVISPAQGLRGHYRVSRALTDGRPEQQLSAAVSTDCLRTGDRCMSYLHSKAIDTPLVFAAGNWTLHVEHDDNDPGCGGLVYAKATGTYALPQPLQDPITALTGHDHLDESSGRPDCMWSVDFAENYTRTGD